MEVQTGTIEKKRRNKSPNTHNRAVTIDQLYKKKRRILQFEGSWKDLIGCPEMNGSWIVWGQSGSGKTSFLMQLLKMLTQFDRVLYNSLEEGDSETMKLAFQRFNIEDVKAKVLLLDQEPMEELELRLMKPKSPNIVFVDSVQYTRMNKYKYYELVRKFKGKKLFIWISHSDGNDPKGKLADDIRYDSAVKIFTNGFMAYAISRYGGQTPYVIWKKGADDYLMQTENKKQTPRKNGQKKPRSVSRPSKKVGNRKAKIQHPRRIRLRLIKRRSRRIG